MLILIIKKKRNNSRSIDIFHLEIVEHPRTQYIVEGSVATFHCNTIAMTAYWRINNTSFATSRPDIQQRFEMQGFTFSSSTNESIGLINLTAQVLATVELNNSLIQCRAASYQYVKRVQSNASYLIVFRTYRK